MKRKKQTKKDGDVELFLGILLSIKIRKQINACTTKVIIQYSFAVFNPFPVCHSDTPCAKWQCTLCIDLSIVTISREKESISEQQSHSVADTESLLCLLSKNNTLTIIHFIILTQVHYH